MKALLLPISEVVFLECPFLRVALVSTSRSRSFLSSKKEHFWSSATPRLQVRSPSLPRRAWSSTIWWEERESKKSLLMKRLRCLKREDLKSRYFENSSRSRMVFFILPQTSAASFRRSSVTFLSSMLSSSRCFSVTSLRILQNIIMFSSISILAGWALSYCWRYLKHFRQLPYASSNCAYSSSSLARKRQQWSMPSSFILMSLQIWMASFVLRMASSQCASSRWQMERLRRASTRQLLMTLFLRMSTQILKCSSAASQFLVSQRQLPYLKRAVEYSMMPQLFLTQLTQILKYFSQQSKSFSLLAISMKLSRAAHILLMISCCSLKRTLSPSPRTATCRSRCCSFSSTFSRMSIASSFFLASMKTRQAMMQSSRYSRCSLALQVRAKKFSSNSSLQSSEYSLQIFMEEKVSWRQQMSALWNFLLLRQQSVSPRCSIRFSISVFSPIMSRRKLFLPTSRHAYPRSCSPSAPTAPPPPSTAYYMLRLFTAARQALHSLKRCVYSRPEELQWLRSKFYANPRFVDKFEYLSKLEGERSLGNFFGDKEVDLLSEEEIYFLFSSEMEYKVDERGRQELMAKLSSTYFKCLVAKEYRWIGEVYQCLIAISFNQELPQLPPYELAFCLEVIADFHPVHALLDRHRLLPKLLRHLPEREHTHSLVLIAGYLLEMDLVLPELHSAANFERWLRDSEQFDFRAIYFLHKLSERTGRALGEAERGLLRGKMREAVGKLQLSYFENNYLAFLLEYYPEYVDSLSLLHFTPRAYLGYLLFYKQNPHIKIRPHRIPPSVVELTSVFAFRNIIEYRMALSLDNALSLAKALPDLFAPSLKAVNSFLSYLRENRVDDLELEFCLERAVEAKLRLNQEFSREAVEGFWVGEVIVLFAHLARDRRCSLQFWRKAVRLLERMIEQRLPTGAPFVESRNDNYINLLSIATAKNFREETRSLVYQELAKLLAQPKNDWPVKSLIKITRVLALNRIGEDELWLLIERRIMKYLQALRTDKEAMGEVLKENLAKLILTFNSMEKGSYQFWHEMNGSLDSKTKKEVLQRAKPPSSIAHVHLTL